MIRPAAAVTLAVAALLARPADAEGIPAGDAADRAYAAIERDFPLRSRADTLAALDDLARRHPASPAATRALLWRGQLALADGDDRTAAASFAAVTRRAPASAEARLADLGAGDLALRASRFDDAAGAFAAAAGAGARSDPEARGTRPALRAVLDRRFEALALARVRHRRGWLAAAAFVLSCGALVGLLLRRRRDAPAMPGPPSATPRRSVGRLPIESLYAAAVLGPLAALGALADHRAAPSLGLCAAGAVGVITLSGIVGERSRGRGAALGLHAAALPVAVCALFYLAAWQGGLLELLRDAG